MQVWDTVGRRQTIHPRCPPGVAPDPALFDRFLECRLDENGNPLLHRLKEKISHPDGWYEYPNAAFDPALLPTSSESPGAQHGRSNWGSRYHACKLEGGYSIVSDWEHPDGGLAASCDRGAGHRYNRTVRGIYVHMEKHRHLVLRYARFVPSFGAVDIYVRVYLELVCDNAWRVPYGHKNQRVQMSNKDALTKCLRTGSPINLGPSVYYKSVWVQIVHYRDLRKGDEFSMIWNPSYEGRPGHINRRLGRNRGERVGPVADATAPPPAPTTSPLAGVSPTTLNEVVIGE